eukprot:5677441-Ditylum_brightwellii.AAC.1
MQMEKAAFGADHKDIAPTLKHLGQSHQQHGELLETLNCFWLLLQQKVVRDPLPTARGLAHDL